MDDTTMPPIDERITALRLEFTDLSESVNENTEVFSSLREKVTKLKDFYSEYIHAHKDNLFIFGLDCFHYQAKIIDVEYDDMHRLYLSITNRMYCEYFKLHQIVCKYIVAHIDDKKVLDVVHNNDAFPMYKDLEPFRQYGFDVISQVHDILLLLFVSMKNVLDHKEDELRAHQAKSDIGFNIDNFVQTLHFDNVVLEQKLSLFLSYLEFFHRLHAKYVSRFSLKLATLHEQVRADVQMDASPQSGARSVARGRRMTVRGGATAPPKEAAAAPKAAGPAAGPAAAPKAAVGQKEVREQNETGHEEEFDQEEEFGPKKVSDPPTTLRAMFMTVDYAEDPTYVVPEPVRHDEKITEEEEVVDKEEMYEEVEEVEMDVLVVEDVLEEVVVMEEVVVLVVGDDAKEDAEVAENLRKAAAQALVEAAYTPEEADAAAAAAFAATFT